MAKDDDTFTAQLLKYADKAVKSVSKAYDKTMGMPEEIAQQTYDYVIAQGGTEEQARGIAGRLASKAGRTTGAIDFMLPQSASDVAFMAAGPLGPATKAGKAALAAGSGLMVMDPDEAQASPLTKLQNVFYRGIPRIREQLNDQVSGLHVKERYGDFTPYRTTKENTKDFAWASDSPDVANSYTHLGGTVIPLELVEKPGASFNAKGNMWNDFFFKDGKLNKEYAEALNDPKVRSVLVENIVDPGSHAVDPLVKSLARARRGDAADFDPNMNPYSLAPGELEKLFTANNVLIKDPDVVRYLYTGEKPKFAEGGAVQGYAVGGGVTDEGLEKLFVDYFGRGSDPGGLKYWKDTAAENQLTLEDIGQKFSESQEYQDQFAGPGVSSNKFAPTSDPSEWKTYYGYKPTTNDYTKMLQAALGEVGVSPSSNQYRAVYEALGNRAAANTISPDYGRGNNTIASLITPQQIHGVNPKSMTRVNSYLRSTDPSTIAAVAAARASLDAYLREGQNRVLTTQTDWRGFQDGEPSPGVTLRGNPFLNRNVPDEGMISLYNTYYDAEDRPDIASRLADLQRQANAIWTPPTPEPRPTDAVLAQVQTFTDEDGRQFTETDGTRRYLDEENPLDTNQTAGRVQTANVEQNVGGQNTNNTIGDDYTFIPSVTPGANTDLGFSTYDPNSFKVYRNDAIDQNSIQQNQLNDSTRNWQQDFNNVVGGQFNMSNPGLVGGYNSSNIGGFDYSGLGDSLGNVGATSGFGLNTGWDFGGGWGFADGGEVNFKKLFEGDSEAMQERARELAREAYSKGYSSLGKKKAVEWEELASKYNLPLSIGPFDNYEDQYSDAVSKWQRGLSPKQRVQTYDEGGPVKADLAVEELTNLQKILAGSNPAANVAPFQLDLGGGAQARGRVVQAGPYIDIGGGITLPLRDVMLMLDASYGKVPGTDMKPNISVKGGLRIPFAEGGAVTPYNADEIAALANQIYEGTNG